MADEPLRTGDSVRSPRDWIAPVLRPQRRQPLDQWALLVVLVSLGFVEVWCRLGLYADGAYLFWTDLQTHGSNLAPNFANGRMIADIIPQLPLIVALHLGVQSVSTLSLVWSAGIVLVPLALWVVALGVLWKNALFWQLAVVAVAVEGTTSFFAIGEYNFAYALVALNVALLVDGLKTIPRRVGFVVAAVATIWSYPSMIYLGPLLVVLVAILIGRDFRTRTTDKSLTVFRVFGIVAYVVATGMAKYSIDNPNGSNVQAASNVLAPFQIDVGQLRWTFAFVALAGASAVFRKYRFFGVLSFAVAVWMVVGERHNDIIHQYDNRIVAGGFVIFGIAIAGLSTLIPSLDLTPRRWLLAAIVVFSVYSLGPIARSATGYHGWLDEVRGLIVSNTTPTTAINGIFTPPSAKAIYYSPYRWTWGYAFVSQDLEPNRRSSMMLDTDVTIGPDSIYGVDSNQLPVPFPYHYTE